MPTIALMLRNNHFILKKAMHLFFSFFEFFAVQGECVGLYLHYHI